MIESTFLKIKRQLDEKREQMIDETHAQPVENILTVTGMNLLVLTAVRKIPREWRRDSVPVLPCTAGIPALPCSWRWS